MTIVISEFLDYSERGMSCRDLVRVTQVVADRTLAGRAYRQMRHDIVSGRLVPGSKLRLEGLVVDYQVGMSPLREALARLVGDLLVVSEGQRGFWVSVLSLDELEDISQVRALLEVEAVGIAVRDGDAAWEARVREAFKELGAIEALLPGADEPLSPDLVETWEDRNRAFHGALVSACRSPWLVRLRDVLYQQSERYRRVSLNISRGRRSVHDEHVAIFEAAMSRQVLRACRMTELHLAQTTAEVRGAISALRDDAVVAKASTGP